MTRKQLTAKWNKARIAYNVQCRLVRRLEAALNKATEKRVQLALKEESLSCQLDHNEHDQVKKRRR